MFRRVTRGYERTLVLARGWAFDNQIFENMDLPFDYAFYEGGRISGFAGDLQAWLASQAESRVTLLGWSMGAYAVSDFALAHPDCVETLWVVGARQHYPEAEVEQVRLFLRRNVHGFLRKFYKDCFAGHALDLYRRFKQGLQKEYLDRWTVPELLVDLEWIHSRCLDMRALDAVCDVVLVHGLEDRFVAEKEARALANEIQRGRSVFFAACGHAPFLEDEFWERVHG